MNDLEQAAEDYANDPFDQEYNRLIRMAFIDGAKYEREHFIKKINEIIKTYMGIYIPKSNLRLIIEYFEKRK